MTPPPAAEISEARRWLILTASTLAQAAAAVSIHGPAFVIPALHEREGLSLAQAGLVAAAPLVGVLVSLVVWGAIVDRRGERFVLVTGLSGAVAAGALAALSSSVLAWAAALFLAGAAAASTSSASGRVVVGWFPPQRRGLAMGIRQMAQPMGVGIGAIAIAVLAEEHGVAAALWAPVACCALALLVVLGVIADPPRPPRSVESDRNPYREDSYLTRIHGVSVLLVVPQFLVWTYALVWLVSDRGWSAAAAGTLVAIAQVAGALGRIAVGHLSDILASRMRPLRGVTAAAALTMLALGLCAGQGWSVAVALMVVATVVTVADNGLAFTAVAERAGPYWSGRALGWQNTAQFLAASAVPPVAGLAITHAGYAATFAAAAAFPLLALGLVPLDQERSVTAH